MRWPWQRGPAPTTIPNPRPDLFSPAEWAREVERWDTIMGPALRQFEAAERAFCDDMGLPPPPPLPRPDWASPPSRAGDPS